MPTITELTAGATPTLLQAEKGNELIKYINGLMSSEGEAPLVVDVDSEGKISISLDVGTSVELDYVNDQNQAARATFITTAASDPSGTV